MALYVKSNVTSLVAQDNLSTSQMQLSNAIQQLSSGLRINSAKDDAAGYVIATGMSSQINGMNQSVRNANDAMSLAQTASAAMQSITQDLQTMRSLAVQSSNATYSATDRAAMQQEVSQLSAEISRVATSTQFNGVNLLDGSFTGQNFQVGPNGGNANTITLSSISNMQAASMGATATSSEIQSSAGTVLAAINQGDLTLNGQSVGASSAYATTTPGQTSDSAYAIAQAINAVTTQSNVTASVTQATNTYSTSDVAAVAAGGLTINGVSLGAVTAGGTTAGEVANLAYAINQISAETGVTASVTTPTSASTTLTLTGSNGVNIVVGGGSAATVFNSLTATTRGKITLTDTTDTSIMVGGNTSANAGFAAGAVTTASTSGATAISTMDISTQSGAQAAISVIDSALSVVNTSSAQLGAYQNRFQAVVSNLQSAVQNLTSAQGQIQNTDFASTTAEMTQAQILQQAGTAMLAQANAMPNVVLTLLK